MLYVIVLASAFYPFIIYLCRIQLRLILPDLEGELYYNWSGNMLNVVLLNRLSLNWKYKKKIDIIIHQTAVVTL